ncbi:uncharacterized protein TM35_000084670 [Trypanosoma theileri]|uniref:Uncharacterized protein n=1 Tax=Trypanosoma theileri TaxID=67003 RepID=A0A1X0P2B8_9TRYP|nr:uncharacterized protein TM35_000084670 [Trypanosoma theileri]ORC90669.1 hypothetical protein TM35_000084670 [Trypanosoma theileri]
MSQLIPVGMPLRFGTPIMASKLQTLGSENNSQEEKRAVFPFSIQKMKLRRKKPPGQYILLRSKPHYPGNRPNPPNALRMRSPACVSFPSAQFCGNNETPLEQEAARRRHAKIEDLRREKGVGPPWGREVGTNRFQMKTIKEECC